MKRAIMILLACVGILGAQQPQPTKEQLQAYIEVLEGNLKSCGGNNKLLKIELDAKADKKPAAAPDSKPDFK